MERKKQTTKKEPFSKWDWYDIRDLERCPYVFWSKECHDWTVLDDGRILLIALDRYADYLQGLRRHCDIRSLHNERTN
jgi:hypothetical protein